MNTFLKRYKEIFIMLLPLFFITVNWYNSMRIGQDFSETIPFKGYEFLFYNRGEAFLLTYVLTLMIQIMALNHSVLYKCSIMGHILCLYCLMIFPIIHAGTYIRNFYVFYNIGAYIAIICEIVVIILNINDIYKKNKTYVKGIQIKEDKEWK